MHDRFMFKVILLLFSIHINIKFNCSMYKYYVLDIWSINYLLFIKQSILLLLFNKTKYAKQIINEPIKAVKDITNNWQKV